MKHTKAILLILLLVGGVFSLSAKELTQAEQVEIWNSANDAYGKGAYDEAIVAYDSLLASGYESAKLYYNLGNAYFKNNRIGKAILNYNRALQLAPSSEDIQYNLQVANAHTVNRIDAVPEFFLTTWFRSLRTMFNSNGWAVLSLIFLGITLAGAMVYLLSGTVRGRKIGFSAGVIALILFIFAVFFSIRQKNLKVDSSEAIVMSSAAPVKSSPDSNGTDLFILNEGAKVTILDNLNGWYEIVIASGNKGWISGEYVEII
ncbi:MAG TPA: tetratricopeptide repeat protein [Candidatus Avirikenella pullistercoris]|nr:tetratricopeptide repeat protein [Candidatus Avirikenella pullistercoris]